MNFFKIVRNEFLHLLGEDHIAVDEHGTPIARATTREGVVRAAPKAAAYLTSSDLDEDHEDSDTQAVVVKANPEPAAIPAKGHGTPGGPAQTSKGSQAGTDGAGAKTPETVVLTSVDVGSLRVGSAGSSGGLGSAGSGSSAVAGLDPAGLGSDVTSAVKVDNAGKVVSVEQQPTAKGQKKPKKPVA